jgi:hypothetical protein
MVSAGMSTGCSSSVYVACAVETNRLIGLVALADTGRT